ncbi:MAG: D-alanine--D-alanine ligase [Leptospiraceae bacterium]|nr:D-alanine--D-alanine ligase [Leptospiraceae bacterium]MCB1199926.1 D-alanine--D-alanine ligase [Leptospiraceae bacterium]
MNILLLYGGQSGEHEISCISAGFIEKNLKANNYQVLPVYINKSGEWHLQPVTKEKPDQHVINLVSLEKRSGKTYLRGDALAPISVEFAFPMVHGTLGEDGALQGLFEIFQLPYAGCSLASSAMAMDKSISRQIFEMEGLDQVYSFSLHRTDFQEIDAIIEDLEDEFNYPVFVKPCNLGSSVGISKAKNPEDLKTAIELALKYDEFVIVEEGRSVREIELAILGNYPDYEISAIGEIIPSHEFYSYEAKYLDQNGAKLVLPAELTATQVENLRELANAAFMAIRGDGFARVDFFLDKESGEFLINEINTLPGFTPVSMFPMLWEKSGKAPVQTVREIVELGLARHLTRSKLQRSRE